MQQLGTLEELRIVYQVVEMVLLYGKVKMEEKLGIIFLKAKAYLKVCGELAVLPFLQ